MPTNPLTLSQEGFRAWLIAERKSIGGTAIGALMGLSPYGGPDTVWDEIMFGRLPSGPRPEFERGLTLEPIIADIFQRESRRRLTGDGRTTVRSARHHYLHATQDRDQEIVEGSTPPLCMNGEGVGVLEIKCLGLRTFTETLEQGVNPNYYAQFQHYLNVLDRRWGSFAIFNADQWRLHWFDLPRNEEMIADMNRVVDQFWEEHVLTRLRPDSRDIPPIAAPPRVGAEMETRADPEWQQAFDALRRAAEEKRLAEHGYEQARTRVESLMGQDREKVHVPGVGKVSWTFSQRESFDKERAIREHPEVDFTPYHRLSEVRSFRFTPDRGRT